MRRRKTNRAAGLLLAGVLAVVGAGALGTTRAAQARPVPVIAGGEDLFRGIMLGHGPVADVLPELWHPRSGPGADPENAVAALDPVLLSRIGADDPGFFDRFESDARSGDHERIVRALAEAAEKLSRARAGQAAPAVSGGSAGLVVTPPVNVPTEPCIAFLCPVYSAVVYPGYGAREDMGRTSLKRDVAAALVGERLSKR